MRVAAVLMVLSLSFAACGERGCLSAWLGDAPSRAAPPTGGDAGMGSPDLAGTDCSDGLARCSEGRVEISVAAHVLHPCAKLRERGGGCECPWVAAGTCAFGCVKDGLEVVAAADVARVQLCQASAGEPVLRLVLATESTAVSICADDGVTCAEGLVRMCAVRGQPMRLVAGCANGCVSGIALDPGDLATGDGPAAILCRRAHAERR